MKSYRTDGWSSRPWRHTFSHGDFPVTMSAVCDRRRNVSTTEHHRSARWARKALHSHRGWAPPRAQTRHTRVYRGRGGGTSTVWATERTEPNWALPQVWGKQGVFFFNWAGIRTLQQKLPALFLSLACWRETFSIFPFAHRVRRDRVCVCVWLWGNSVSTFLDYPDAVVAATVQRLLTERDADGQSSELGWRRCVEEENGGAVVASADS